MNREFSQRNNYTTERDSVTGHFQNHKTRRTLVLRGHAVRQAVHQVEVDQAHTSGAESAILAVAAGASGRGLNHTP